MRKFFKKLMLGHDHEKHNIPTGALGSRADNIKAIWHNQHHEDVGIEKLFRLFLATSQFIFPGTYIKALFGRMGLVYQEVAVDIYVLIKTSLPLVLLYTGAWENDILYYLICWFLVETCLYVPTLIFASDIFSRPRSYRRALLLLFMNYMEVIGSFAVIHARGNYLNIPFTHWFDPFYFSFITSTTIGYGDFFPVSPFGKVMVILQALIFFVFVFLLLNFFTSRVESKGYFDKS
jgi:hypothetical protein